MKYYSDEAVTTLGHIWLCPGTSVDLGRFGLGISSLAAQWTSTMDQCQHMNWANSDICYSSRVWERSVSNLTSVGINNFLVTSQTEELKFQKEQPPHNSPSPIHLFDKQNH